jgi:hypothetical protein
MTEHPENLELYNQLSDEERRQIDKHVETCAECREDLAFWSTLSHQIFEFNEDLDAPDAVLDRVLAAPPSSRLRQVWTLLRSQIRLVRRELFPASAALMILGVGLALVAHRATVFYVLAPMIAAGSVAAIYGRSHDPALELTLSTPTSAWKILLARLTLISGYNLVLALAASSVLLAAMPAGLYSAIVLGWLGPLTFLSAFALVLSMWTGAGPALVISYTAWIIQWLPLTANATAYRAFWNNSALLIGLAMCLVAAAMFSAERVARPRAEAA